MSNSSLVSYKKLSPNHSGKRTHSIDRITPHCVVGQLSVESLGSMFAKPSKEASCNYGIGSDGRVALIVDEDKRSWCSSSKSNDQRAVTIECASDASAPYAFNPTVYSRLIDLCVDICKRNGKTKLLWISDKAKALAYEPKSGEMLLTVHRWFASKSCPGDWMMARMGDLASKVTARLSGAAASAESARAAAAGAALKYYRVRKAWKDIDSQVGAYLFFENAKEEADRRGSKYAVFDWAGKEIYRPAKKEEKASTKEREIRFYYPGYTRRDSPDDRQGAGCIWHDQDGKVLVYDAYMKDSEPAKKMVQYLKDNDLEEVDTAVVSHAHVDHGGGIIRMLEAGIKIRNFLCYNPASLKLAGTGSGNARGVLEDKEYLQDLISLAKSKGATVRYIDDGDTVTCGEMVFDVYRDQPDHFTANDGGYGWAYTNDGSLCLYERDLGVLLVGDADGEHAADLCGVIYIVECGHHGNNSRASIVAKFKAKGLRLAIECNNEKNGPGTCSFTQFCAGRMIEAGVEVWQLDGDITGRAVKGKMYVKHGKKSRSFDVEFGKKPAEKKPTEQEKFIAKIGPLAKANMAKTGILACITIAQAILESGWGMSDLAVKANNLFGMKKKLSGNTWSGSVWDGKSTYSKQTGEVYSGQRVTVQADFRAYKSWAESVVDHGAYLAGAKSGSVLRYSGLAGCTDYKKAAQIIKDGDYATATDYVQKICRIIEQYDLTDWDWTPATPTDSRKLDDMHTVKWIGKAKIACSGYLYPSATAKMTVDVPEGAAIGVCKGVGKFYLAKVGSKYGYVHRSHVKK